MRVTRSKADIYNQDSPIFIVGMPRSGTTLISRILSSHSQIIIAPESHYMNYWMQKFPPNSLQSEENFKIFWNAFTKSERFSYFECDASQLLATVKPIDQNKAKAVFSNLLKQYAQSKNKQRWGEKTPAHYAYIDYLLAWYPNARIIYMMRDPRGVAASMAKVPWGGKRIISYALRWQDSAQCLEKWSQDERILCIQYEYLLSDPSSTLEKICQFTGEDFQEKMLISDNIVEEESINLYSSDWAVAHLNKAAQPIITNSLSKWKTILSPHEIALIEYLNQESMQKLGYEVTENRIGLIARIGVHIYIISKRIKKTISRRLIREQLSRSWA